jgi:hypothetical protein
MSAEWVGGVTVRGTPALHPNGIPRQYLIKKAHPALVRNVPFNPGTI